MGNIVLFLMGDNHMYEFYPGEGRAGSRAHLLKIILHLFFCPLISSKHVDSGSSIQGPCATLTPLSFSPPPCVSLAAATPPNLVDKPCLKLKVYVRPTSK